MGAAVRRIFAGYGWYDGVVCRARLAGASVEYEVEWEVRGVAGRADKKMYVPGRAYPHLHIQPYLVSPGVTVVADRLDLTP